ncbi:MAG: right-handed parallel beta-helix repeat-containing protein [Phycisphaeraceae bacterium]|nr:right-handed parallel beta-helix repeat-containing protein [Phycisphaerales bacterium]MCB9841923.1 right-handed parallel beta-helix repeat-containing protein [Phycisphaeraceae bacterium]
MKTRTGLLGVVVLATVFVGWSFAGDLNPPAGTVAPTMKTLDELEPRIAINAANTPGNSTTQFVISQPGSYYLTGNINALGSRTAIRVDSDGVTIDLNGFEINGTGASGTPSGVSCLGLINSAPTIRNGQIRNWPGIGVFMVGDGGVLEDLAISGNTAQGVQLSDHGAMRRCTLIGNGGITVRTFDSCTVEDCTIETAGSSAIQSGSANLIRRNNIRATSASTDGVLANGIYTRVEDNNLSGTIGNIGISAASNTFVARNTVFTSFAAEYNMSAGTKYGPIITADGDLSTITNADHPWANFVY